MANFAFIDSQNVNLGVLGMGWKLDFSRFRIYLYEKYMVEKAFLFIGYIKANESLYEHLRQAGYICIFRPTLAYANGITKGNCDAELVLHTMIEFPNYNKAIIISGDGDFYCLIKHLIEHNKLEALIVPNESKYSALLKQKVFRSYTRSLNGLEKKLSYKKKRPRKDETLKG